ncbi:hypothetical protein AB0M47_20865 [Hamadaea sp. NPDC051192]|uniref:hypothetical protein n=1 Tax=Hamadaea sp. NPDC051192 TaxID=3154940 RepID=UPI00341A09C2
MSQHTSSEAVQALRQESDRLFAEHRARSAAYFERAQVIQAEMAACLDRQADAFAREEQAWQACEAAATTARANPGQPHLSAAVDQAQAAYQDARSDVVRVEAEIRHTMSRLSGESWKDFEEVSALGAAFRAAQDAYLDADWNERHPTQPTENPA